MNLMDDDFAVKIAVRERPLREIFKNSGVPSAINYHSSNSNILVVDERPFAFDHVLPPSVSQEELFNFLVMPLVSKVLQGFNCTTLAYGQTGTGKSFTMGLNPESLEGINVGMIPRCIQAILDSKMENELNKSEISASFIEIYSEKVFDLLSETPSEPIIARGYKFTGGTKKTMNTIQDGYNLLHQGTKNRHVRPTKMNAQSSRSHAIFTIYVRNEIQNKITQSCLNLVDLAGSEGVRRTGHQGVALSEGVHINQGLLSIGKVLQAITHGYKVIPYRDSVLSSVLQDSLNPNSYFTLLACISPHREDLSETLSTLRFAQNAKNLKNNPQINSKLMELKKSKTPYKSNPLRPKNTIATPTPCKRPFSLANNPNLHGNTFCTPNKKRKTENPIFNRTVVGLTPKEKQKIGTVKMPVSKVVPFSYEPSSVRESINSDIFSDLDLLGSRASLNISSSTTIDAPQNNKAPSTYSPIVRKCMAEVENTFKSSMSQFLENLKSTQSVQKPSLFNSSPLSCERERIRTIIRQELFSLTREKNSEEIRKIDNGINKELFADESSPLFKIPALPDIKQTPDPCSSLSLDLNSTENEQFSNIEETVLPVKPLRRSRRLSSRAQSLGANNDSVIVPKRRSTRLSIKSLHDVRRRSIRLMSHKEHSLEEVQEELKTPVKQNDKPTTSRTVKKSKKPAGSLVQNPTIAGYFEGKENKSTNLKSNLAKHQKAILEMLNSASMKELQYLPQIGLKTAFQIVTQRTLHGKFKNFTQVSKLPIWRGKAWERFKEANNIS
ncbi:kinesin-like protein Nod [Episyrphus balteatus]|uniref:kinesin-like protein Nod n=1 Tax=Episyrphus balteatus TaxID=286459 RepID=UPI0024860612|nr:kinesin-like protein Nod [Episyrphus balteatus]